MESALWLYSGSEMRAGTTLSSWDSRGQAVPHLRGPTVMPGCQLCMNHQITTCNIWGGPGRAHLGRPHSRAVNIWRGPGRSQQAGTWIRNFMRGLSILYCLPGTVPGKENRSGSARTSTSALTWDAGGGLTCYTTCQPTTYFLERQSGLGLKVQVGVGWESWFWHSLSMCLRARDLTSMYSFLPKR